MGETVPMPRLILWDIDGTLVRVGDIGAVIFDVAIERRFGRPPSSRVVMSGKTDPQIVLEYLTAFDIPDAHTHLPAILDDIETELAAQAQAIGTQGTVLPGVAELLARFDADDDVVQTVLTGNIAANARVKLAAFGLDRWLHLDMGAYGSDHADRTELVPIARRKVEEAMGLTFTADEIWVVGDAPNDLACARAAGVRCLLVATGRPTYDELRALQPDALRRDLSDVDAIDALLTPSSSPPGPAAVEVPEHAGPGTE
jgi:phosphoglycolate phosphatase